jgi:methylmalonyl-CoA mutase cobalamin-binding subunit
VFASTSAEALTAAAAPDVAAVVVSAALERAGIDGQRLTRHLPALSADDPAIAPAWVINTPPKEIAKMLGRVAQQDTLQMAVHDAFSAPANVLFVVNDVLNQETKNARKSERVLYGTVVRFRPAGRGRSDEDVGYSYNLSAGGLYVRTLALPDDWHELWLEFVPPRSDRAIHLEATAMWTRGYGRAGSATVPSGFGVRITGGSSADLERYDRSYKAFVAERAVRHASTPTPYTPAKRTRDE